MEYYNKIGLRKLPQVLINGFPLKENELENDLFEEAVITKIMQITQEIQFAFYHVKKYFVFLFCFKILF
jgi:UDP-glucose:glycoprotein glucosyltransferase